SSVQDPPPIRPCPLNIHRETIPAPQKGSPRPAGRSGQIVRGKATPHKENGSPGRYIDSKWPPAGSAPHTPALQISALPLSKNRSLPIGPLYPPAPINSPRR